MSNQLAKLLATENITVVRETTDTATFDIETRVLTIPIFNTEFSKNLEHLFIGHEVSHALHTNLDIIEAKVKELTEKVYARYIGAINIAEDVRIDKLIKLKYPGLKSDYGIGLKELRNADFFEVNNKDFHDLNLLDKVNIYFKGYPEIYSIFTPEEVDLIERIDLSSSQEDSILLGIELYEMAKEQQKQNSQQSEKSEEKSEGNFENAESSSEESDDETDSDESNKKNDKKVSENSSDKEDDEKSEDKSENTLANYSNEEIECNTQKAFDKNLKASYEQRKVIVRSVMLENDLNSVEFSRIIHPYKEILKNFPTFSDKGFKAFKDGSAQKVSALVKEFEMKKAATRFTKTQVSKSGYLDMNKVFSYQYNEDIFKRMTTIKDEKNHGMIFLLDWSGSMYRHMHVIIEQMYVLTTFCRQVKIPFRVFAFTSLDSKLVFPTLSYNKHSTGDRLGMETNYIMKNGVNLKLSNVRPFNILELASSDMSEAEYNLMMMKLFNTGFNSASESIYLHEYGLGATPLNSALAYMYFYLPQFKVKYNIEKMTMITLTDGVSHPISRDQGIGMISVGNHNFKDVSDMYVNFVSPTTRKEYKLEDINSKGLRFGASGVGQWVRQVAFETNALVRMLKDENVNMISISVVKSKSEQVDAIMCLTCEPYSTVKNKLTKVETGVQESFYNKSFIVYANELEKAKDAAKNMENILKKASTESVRKLAGEISRNKANIRKGQTLLNAFIGTIA